MISLKPRPTADTAHEHLSADGFLLFGNEDGLNSYCIWRVNQGMPLDVHEPIKHCTHHGWFLPCSECTMGQKCQAIREKWTPRARRRAA